MNERYKLLKDLPNANAGETFKRDELKKLEEEHKNAMEAINAFNKEMKGFIEAGKERKYL